MTTHHLICQSWGGNSHPNNTRQIKENYHRAVHTVFQDATPLGQHRKLLQFNGKTMNPEVYEMINGVLRKFEGIMEIEAYHPHCVHPDKFLTRLHRCE